MTWVDDRHVGCSVGDMADHGGCYETNQPTCTWCGHWGCYPPSLETDLVAGIKKTLELVAQERMSQLAKHGEAMRALPDGTGPETSWTAPLAGEWVLDARSVQELFREDYEKRLVDGPAPDGQLTRMHLVREEIAEAFEADPDSPEFVAEIIQVAALCVQWAEYKTGH